MNKLIARKGKRAFTLIELIVVVAILGILSLIAIPSFNGFREAANAGVAYTNASELARSATALYELDSNTPDPLAVAASEAGVTLVNGGVVVNGWCSAITIDENNHYVAAAAVEGDCSGGGGGGGGTPAFAATCIADPSLGTNVTMMTWNPDTHVLGWCSNGGSSARLFNYMGEGNGTYVNNTLDMTGRGIWAWGSGSPADGYGTVWYGYNQPQESPWQVFDLDDLNMPNGTYNLVFTTAGADRLTISVSGGVITTVSTVLPTS